jgi:hypothetical protein
MTDRKCFHCFTATLVLAVALAAGCASTTLQSTWMDPGYTGGPFKKFFIVGLSARAVATRRVFEDIVVAKLQAAGAQAVPAWQFFVDEGQANETAMDAAVAQSGADAVLMTRLLGVDTRTNVSTMMVPGPIVGPGFGPGFAPGPGWWGGYSGWYAVPQVTQYQIATAETTLFDVKTHKIVWSATSQTFNPTSVQQEAPGLADAVIQALQARSLIATNR